MTFLYAKLYTAQLISAFIFTTCIVPYLFYLNPKFQAASHLLCLTWLETPKTGFLTTRLVWSFTRSLVLFLLQAATSPKMYLDNWNIQTAVWLRHICYDRLKFQKRFLTFLLSALWHGMYPGYYFTFVLGALFSDMARQVWITSFEPRHEKTCLRGFQPGPTQTRLYSHRSWLEAWNFGFRKYKNCNIYEAKFTDQLCIDFINV